MAADVIFYPFGGRVTPSRVVEAIQHAPDLTEHDVERFARHELTHDELTDLYMTLRRTQARTEEALRHMATRVIVYTDKGGEWRWQIRGRNHEIIAASSEGYSSRVKAKDNLLLLQRLLMAVVVFSHQEEE